MRTSAEIDEEHQSERFIELEEEVESDSAAEKELGKTTSAYLRDYTYVGLEDIPSEYRSYLSRQHDFVPGEENFEELRETFSHLPSVYSPEAFIQFELYHPRVGEFRAYEKASVFDWDDLAKECNANDVADLANRGIPISFDTRRKVFRPVEIGLDEVFDRVCTNSKFTKYALFGLVCTLAVATAIVPTVLAAELGMSQGVLPWLTLAIGFVLIFLVMRNLHRIPPAVRRLTGGNPLPDTPYMSNFDTVAELETVIEGD